MRAGFGSGFNADDQPGPSKADELLRSVRQEEVTPPLVITKDPLRAEPPASRPTDEFANQIADIMEMIGALNDAVGIIRNGTEDFGERLSNAEKLLTQVNGQVQQFHSHLNGHANALNIHEARIGALGQAIAKNYRVVAVEAASRCRQPGDSPTRMKEIAQAFLDVLIEPAKPEEPQFAGEQEPPPPTVIN